MDAGAAIGFAAGTEVKDSGSDAGGAGAAAKTLLAATPTGKEAGTGLAAGSAGGVLLISNTATGNTRHNRAALADTILMKRWRVLA